MTKDVEIETNASLALFYSLIFSLDFFELRGSELEKSKAAKEDKSKSWPTLSRQQPRTSRMRVGLIVVLAQPRFIHLTTVHVRMDHHQRVLRIPFCRVSGNRWKPVPVVSGTNWKSEESSNRRLKPPDNDEFRFACNYLRQRKLAREGTTERERERAGSITEAGSFSWQLNLAS